MQTTLADGEAGSFWLSVRESRTSTLEIAGRALVDTYLMQNGTWVMADRRQIVRRSPTNGEPVTIIEMAVKVSPPPPGVTKYARSAVLRSLGAADER